MGGWVGERAAGGEEEEKEEEKEGQDETEDDEDRECRIWKSEVGNQIG